MKIYTLILLFLNLQLMHAQNYDQHMQDFSPKDDIARWLVEYDAVVWRTSDSVMTHPPEITKKLGNHWFAFKDDKNTWHASYGKLTKNRYHCILYYTINPDEILTEDTIPNTDTVVLYQYAIAIDTALKVLRQYADSIPVRMNQYVKNHGDGTFTIYYLPAYQNDGSAVYGGEIIIEIDKNGFISKKEVNIKEFRKYNPGKDLKAHLRAPEAEYMPLNFFFFARYYHAYFDNIEIENKHFISSLKYTETGNAPFWVHAIKDVNVKIVNQKKKKKK